MQAGIDREVHRLRSFWERPPRRSADRSCGLKRRGGVQQEPDPRMAGRRRDGYAGRQFSVVIVMIVVVVVVMIVPIMIGVPAVSVFVPPAMTVVPTVGTCFGKLTACVICFWTLPAMVFDRFMNAMVGFGNAFLAIICRGLGSCDENCSSEEKGGEDGSRNQIAAQMTAH
jgi:hypothetical protein